LLPRVSGNIAFSDKPPNISFPEVPAAACLLLRDQGASPPPPAVLLGDQKGPCGALIFPSDFFLRHQSASEGGGRKSAQQMCILLPIYYVLEIRNLRAIKIQTRHLRKRKSHDRTEIII